MALFDVIFPCHRGDVDFPRNMKSEEAVAPGFRDWVAREDHVRLRFKSCFIDFRVEHGQLRVAITGRRVASDVLTITPHAANVVHIHLPGEQ